MLAASNGHLDLVKIFLDVNARVDVFDQEARSALHLAAESGNADICEMLLAKNAYVNSKTKAGWTPLHYVAFNGFNELIHPLVTKHNAAIDATSMKKQTPLHLAASAGKQAACDMLISLGAGVDSTDDFGQKPVSVT